MGSGLWQTEIIPYYRNRGQARQGKRKERPNKAEAALARSRCESCRTVIIAESAIRGLSRERGWGAKSNESTADDGMPPCAPAPSLDEGNDGGGVGGVRDAGFRAVGRFCLVPRATRGTNARDDPRRGTGASRHRPRDAPSGTTWKWRRGWRAGDLEAGRVGSVGESGIGM